MLLIVKLTDFHIRRLQLPLLTGELLLQAYKICHFFHFVADILTSVRDFLSKIFPTHDFDLLFLFGYVLSSVSESSVHEQTMIAPGLLPGGRLQCKCTESTGKSQR